MEAAEELIEADKKLREKVLEHFTGSVVRKDLAFQVKGNLPVPTYVLEYLLAQYCTSPDEAEISKGLEKVKEVISQHYFNRADSGIIQGRIHDQGSYVIIDKVSAWLVPSADGYYCSFANLELNSIPIDQKYIKGNEKLLSGTGVWCIVKLKFVTGDDVPCPWQIETFKPIQIANVDVDHYISLRKNFTTEEWMDFLIHTVGLNPCIMNRREKMIVLARLLPYVENNFNFMELGPKGTGKSHVYQEFSPYGVLVSGGDVTSARLFVKITPSREVLGLVGYWDNVAWDEFEQQKGKSTDGVLVDTMQNYLANKAFNRGGATHEASASMCFVGNTKHNVAYMLRRTHLFESIPDGFIKGAFLDRVHLFNPGWEMSPLKKSSFSDGYGMITDYIAAVLHALRMKDFSGEMAKYAKFSGTLSERDHNGIRKTFSGFVKLLYPDGNFTDEEAIEIIEFAGESRRRVKDELYKIDETFRAEPAKFEYTLVKTGEKRTVRTLEAIENGVGDFGSGAPAPAEAVPTAQPAASAAPLAQKAKDRVKLEPKSVSVKMNQKGVSYANLFGDYLRDASVITIVDPFIRKNYQFDNLVELIRLIADENDNIDEGVKIDLHTGVDEGDPRRQTEIFEEMKTDLASAGIEFDYTFDAVHDRYIKTDDGWTIQLGRGLDIFDRFERYSLERTSQERRRCREFNMAILPSVVQESLEQKRTHWKDFILPIPPPPASASDELYLMLAYEFYDAIVAGTKKTEYRAYTPNWVKKVLSHPIKTVRFQRGYGGPGHPPAEQMVWNVDKIWLYESETEKKADPANPSEGFVPDCIAIDLGSRIQ